MSGIARDLNVHLEFVVIGEQAENAGPNRVIALAAVNEFLRCWYCSGWFALLLSKRRWLSTHRLVSGR